MTYDIDARLDSELAAVRARYPSLGFDLSDIEGSRAIMSMMAEKARLPEGMPVALETLFIPGPGGAPDVGIRLFRPTSTVAPALPALLWIHGGGFVLGSAADTDRRLGEMAIQAGCIVASVDYRLAPENPYPAAMDDCAAALDWILTHGSTIGVDDTRLAIGGASAGAGLAAGLALRERDGKNRKLRFQLLIYPMLDDRNDYHSSHGIEDPKLWNRETNLRAWELYLGDGVGPEDVAVYAAPGRAQGLEGLPPAFVAVGDLDIFLDEDINYAQRLLQAGVPTELHVYLGAIHGFDMLAPGSRLARRFNAEVDEALSNAFAHE